MSPEIEKLKRRKIQLYEIHAGSQLVRVTVEMPSPRETAVGVSIALGARAPALESSEVDVTLLGNSRFNPVMFPREGPLPELRAGGVRAALAAFRFEAVEQGSRPSGLELKLRGRIYQIRFNKGATSIRDRKSNIPASVAKVLPKGFPGRKLR